jgi:hypothetical protein
MSNPYRHFNTGEASKYDDFDPKKNYVKVLYNPSRAVQARELTQGQTYLNHQIAAMGGYLFQDGQPIDGAKISFSENQPIVKVAFAVPPSDIKATLDSVVGEIYYTTASTGQSIIITGYEIINNEYYKLELFENNSAPCSYCHFLERPSLKCTFPDGNKKECEFKKGTKKGWNTFEYVKV